MKELKPKLILPTAKDGRRGGSFKQFLIILAVFLIGIFVGITIGGMREIDDSNGKTSVDERSREKKVITGTDEEEPVFSEEGSPSLENGYGIGKDGKVWERSSDDKDIGEDNKKFRTNDDTGVRKHKGVYTVQVAAFRASERAHKAQRELIFRGYDPYLVPYVNSLGETWILVRIGKFDSRNEAEEFAVRYQRSEAMDAFVEESDQ